MIYYHGPTGRGPYFEGWYLKHQGGEGGLAVIPSIHRDGRGEESASLQIITNAGSRAFSFSPREFQAEPRSFQIQMGNNWFGRDGVSLELRDGAFSLRGDLRYGPLTPLKEDIMGPFRMAPGMQCVHGVVSMGHRVDGALTLNGRSWLFSDGLGYIEMDRGRSFPKRYLWTQCIWRGRQRGSLMLAIAHIPMPLGGFTGCICELRFAGRSYRLATYRGARAVRWSACGAELQQGALRLSAELLSRREFPLQAPQGGGMGRTIYESLSATVRYRLWEDGRLVFDHIDDQAGFEFAELQST